MAFHSLSKNFQEFYRRLNPDLSFEQIASSQHRTIRGLIENRNGPAAELFPITFLQGSYRQQTAIHKINDVDIVALCGLSYPGSSCGFGKSYNRDEIFEIIAAPLLADGRYRDKVRFGPNSMCIKVDLGIKVEILPVVFKAGTADHAEEPFVLYRPESKSWEDGFARYHQSWLSKKNSVDRTQGNFIPAIKVLKHIRSLFSLSAVSFHIESLLYRLLDTIFLGDPADYLAALFRTIASFPADQWYNSGYLTPCGDRKIFSYSEWLDHDWREFYRLILECSQRAERAIAVKNECEAIEMWQEILGSEFFPGRVLFETHSGY